MDELRPSRLKKGKRHERYDSVFWIWFSLRRGGL
jgi:hypothetical protein